MKKEMVIADAQMHGLTVGEITHSYNDYPNNLGDNVITGFDSFEDAEEFANKHGLTICSFTKKDGHHFWHKGGNSYRPFSSDEYIHELGDDYSEACINNEDIKMVLSQIVNDFSGDFKHIKEFIEMVDELRDAIESKCDDEVVIVKGFTYIETVNKELMTFHVDVTRYSIGVLLNCDE